MLRNFAVGVKAQLIPFGIVAMNATIARRHWSAWPALLLSSALFVFAVAASAEDWPMFGRDKTRNSVSPENNPPVSWDTKTGQNIKWKAATGGYTFGTPAVANGLVWIGTNNENPQDPASKGTAGVLMCFRETDGQFLYQHVSLARQGPTYWQAQTGIACSPLIEGDRLWFVTTSSEILCLDIGPLHRGKGLPTQIWKVDMLDELACCREGRSWAEG